VPVALCPHASTHPCMPQGLGQWRLPPRQRFPGEKGLRTLLRPSGLSSQSPAGRSAPRVAPRRAESAQPGRRLLRARADAEAALVGVARRQVARARRRRVAQQRAARGARSGLAAAARALSGHITAPGAAAHSNAAWAYGTYH